MSQSSQMKLDLNVISLNGQGKEIKRETCVRRNLDG